MSDASRDFLQIDWSRLPAPVDDGAAGHLPGLAIPEVTLPATDGSAVSLGSLAGRTVVYAFPLTGRPGAPLPKGWDEIPGARGCAPQNCAFRDHHAELLAAGAGRVFGLSTQDASYQREAAERLHLPFPLLSDAALRLTTALKLPVMLVDGDPVFPPDRNAPEVLAWLRAQSE